MPLADTSRAIADTSAALGVDPERGLDDAEVAERRERYGPNRLAEPPRRSSLLRFLDQFRSLLILVLAVAAALAAIVGDLKDAVVVAIVLFINAVLGFVQEGRAENALASLKEMLIAQVRVRRAGEVRQVGADELVPGDVVLLEAGDRLPADGQFRTAVNLAIDESSLTGESLPVDKTTDAPERDDVPLGEQRNRGFMNTSVVRGRAELVVTDTGMATEMGKVAELMSQVDKATTPLQDQLDRLGKRLAMIAGIAVTLVFVVGLAQGDTFADALLGAVALAIAAIPEGLPAVVTVTLAVGVHQMALRKAIVKRLASVETLGSTTVICSDKTGTLTMNEMTARDLVLGGQHFEVTGQGYGTEGRIAPPSPALADALLGAALCNDSHLRDGDLVGDPTEGALLAVAAKAGIDAESVREASPRLAEVPFDAAAKFMATYHRLDDLPMGTGPSSDDDVVLFVKGAPDVVLGRCTQARTDGSANGDPGAVALDDAARARWEAENEGLAGQGQRVLAVAHRRLAAADVLAADGSIADPDRWVEDLTLDVLVGIVDPPRPEARDAIELCRQAGIEVKMITGDHAATASAIAGELGIRGDVVTGAELEAMSDDELERRIDAIAVCARVSPEHKVRVVRALSANGHVVAMTGDGVNDAAALRNADIGVAMGITGTEVTKEAADLVLADDNFATIVGAVERGRAIYDNILKFVRFQLTTNLAAIGTILGASLAGLPAPLSAIQVLFINIIADGPPAMTLGVDPPSPGTMQRRPRDPGAAILTGPRLWRVLSAAIVMMIGTLAVFATTRSSSGELVGATMAFTTFVFYQLANVFNARTEDASVLTRESLRNGKLWAVIALVAGLQVIIVMWSPLQQVFGTAALSAAQWAVCIGVALTVVIVEEARKALFRSRGSAAPRSPEASPSLPSAP